MEVKLPKPLKLREGETLALLAKRGEREPLDLSFGPSGVWLNPPFEEGDLALIAKMREQAVAPTEGGEE